MLKLKNSVFTVLLITLLISSVFVLKLTKIYAEEFANNRDSDELVSYAIGSDVSKHTISGYVKDKKTGDPIKNVKVILDGLTTPNRGTKTDSEGYFKLENVLEDTYVLKIEKDGYKKYDKSVKIDGNDLELEVSIGFYTISGYVTDKKADEPIGNAKVKLNESTKTSMETETNSKGYFEFEYVSQGSHTVKIEKDGYSDYEKKVRVDEDDVKLVFNLKSQGNPCIISGYVKDDKTGEPVNNAIVRLNGLSNWIDKTDDKGYFKFEGMTEVTYTLKIEETGYSDYIQSILAEDADIELDINLKQGEVSYINVEINNNKVEFIDSTGYPFIDENNRTLVPLRKTLESFGAKVEWNNDKKLVSVTKNNNTIYIPTNESYIIVNDKKVPNDSKAIIKNGRMYCPIRVIIDGLGGILTWDEKTQTVVINEKEEI